MFEKLENVPLAIKEFYHEMTVLESLLDENGKLVTREETYEYYDGNGELQTGVRLAPVYHEVTYVKENNRNDLKSWDFVELVMSRKGKFEFIKHCINKACESERWQFHDEYIKWCNSAPNEADERYSLVDEDGLPLHPFAEETSLWPSQEPIDTSTDPSEVVARHNRELAINSRYDAIYQTLPVTLSSGVSTFVDIGVGKDGVLGVDNIKGAVISHQAGHEATEVYWVMADNSVELVTVSDLQGMLVEFNKRKQFVFQQYGVWRQGDCLHPFEVNQ